MGGGLPLSSAIYSRARHGPTKPSIRNQNYFSRFAIRNREHANTHLLPRALVPHARPHRATEAAHAAAVGGAPGEARDAHSQRQRPAGAAAGAGRAAAAAGAGGRQLGSGQSWQSWGHVAESQSRVPQMRSSNCWNVCWPRSQTTSCVACRAARSGRASVVMLPLCNPSPPLSCHALPLAITSFVIRSLSFEWHALPCNPSLVIRNSLCICYSRKAWAQLTKLELVDLCGNGLTNAALEQLEPCLASGTSSVPCRVGHTHACGLTRD